MIDFGLVDAVDAEAIGPPGQRTFRLRANKDENYAALRLFCIAWSLLDLQTCQTSIDL